MPLAKLPVAKLHAPLLFTVAMPSCVVPLNTVTVLLAAAVPVRVTTLVETTSLLITGADRRSRVDLWAGLGQAGQRQVGGIAGAVSIVAPLRLTAVAARAAMF